MQKIFFILIIVLSSLSAITQPLVRNEPRHHNVFENDYIRILDVFIPPGDTSQFHIHNIPSVFTTFTQAASGSQLLGKQPVNNISVAGFSWYDSLATPRIHRVWDNDSVWFHAMDIELIGGKPHSGPALLQSPFLELFFNAPLANGYHLQLPSNKSLQLPVSSIGYLLVSTADAIVEYKVNEHIQHRFMKSAHYLWIEPGKLFTLTADGNSPTNFLLLQLK